MLFSRSASHFYMLLQISWWHNQAFLDGWLKLFKREFCNHCYTNSSQEGKRLISMTSIPLNFIWWKRLQTMLWHHNAGVNSHRRWKQTRFRVCFHLWCELTSTMKVTEWQVSWNSWSGQRKVIGKTFGIDFHWKHKLQCMSLFFMGII